MRHAQVVRLVVALEYGATFRAATIFKMASVVQRLEFARCLTERGFKIHSILN
jgi:hypothetical protein